MSNTMTTRRTMIPIVAITLILLAISNAFARAEAIMKLNTGWTIRDTTTIPDDGPQISSRDYSAKDWTKATVPGTVLGSLVDAGVYPYPFYGLNNSKIPETLARSNWWYRTQFDLPKNSAGRHVWLRFNGINYIAAVWLNGSEVGAVRGAFSRGEFDVSRYVDRDKPNALAVQIFTQPNPGDAHGRSFAKGMGGNGGLSAIDGPTFLSSIGWDWQPTVRDRCSGIWQDVEISTTGPVVIADPYVTSVIALPALVSADLTVEATLHNAGDEPVICKLSGKITDAISFGRDVPLNSHETRVVTFTADEVPALRVKNPRLWWPNGYGSPDRYTLNLQAEVKGVVSDSRDTQFGIRRIDYAMKGSDNLALVVNGVPVVAKGGNWALDESLKRISPERIDAQMRMHQQANYTIVRNWVGQSTSDAFYDACDKYGLLIWDEFFQPNPSDGPNPTDIDLYLANVKEKLLRYRQHPSIALWCARNEGFPPKRIGDGIKKLIEVYDGARLYQASSTDGRGVISHGPYRWRTPQEYYEFNPEKEAFKTEIGSMSVPTLQAVKAMIPPSDWETVGDSWAERDFAPGAQAGDLYVDAIADRYGEIANLADFVRKSQLANYEAYRAMYEGRFAKLFSPVTGIITWMSNPSQPSFVWQLYSHDLEPNASLFAVQNACEPVHVMFNQQNRHLMVINNRPEELKHLRMHARVLNLDSVLKATIEKTIDSAAASAVTDLGELEFPSDVSAVHFVKLELIDSSDKVVSENFYWRGTSTDDLKALDQLPTAKLDVATKMRVVGDETLIEVILTNPGPSIAMMAHLQLRFANNGERVLPVRYSENYITLLSGESRAITVSAASRDLKTIAPKLGLDGWNITLRDPTNTGDVVVVVDPETQVRSLPSTTLPAATRSHLKIDCGGSGHRSNFTFGQPRATDSFGRDRFVTGGNVATSVSPIDTKVPNAGPERMYLSERWGDCTYRLPTETGHVYTVRMHFADPKFEAGKRVFDVLLNGQTVLHDFDISAEGGQKKAVVKTFEHLSATDGHVITISLKRGPTDEPKICGIELIDEKS